ncbi:hypothetical protein [Sphingobium boeckii]|uniref:RcnB family protein n=1 Tax=Sphingobium boeckii TaxID=1082345 RepID=A0A7W9AIM0_9SPHN|nr:hypothetical protein [Sphingobium boeckii]MBB5686131.1 hypothetical protein [Sphingobium boeckii]
MGLLIMAAALPSTAEAQRDSGGRDRADRGYDPSRDYGYPDDRLDYDLDYGTGDDRVTGPGYTAGAWSDGWDARYEERNDRGPRQRPPHPYHRPPPPPHPAYHHAYPAGGYYYAPPGATTIIIQPAMVTTTTVVEEYYDPAPARTVWRAKAKSKAAWKAKPKPRCVCR